LTMVRIGLTPVLAGLAAVGGVFVLAMAGSVMSGPGLTPMPPQSVASGSAAAARVAPLLLDVFSLRANPFGLLFAAVFGLAPNLLIGALQSTADGYKADLQTTSAPARKADA